MSVFAPRDAAPSIFDALRPRPRRRNRREDRRSAPERDRLLFRPGNGLGTPEQLEGRLMLDGSTDLTASISSYLTTNDYSTSHTINNVVLGKFLTAQSATVSFANIAHNTTTNLWSGTISVAVQAPKIAIDSSVNGSITTLTTTYTLANQATDHGSYSLTAQGVTLADANVFSATIPSVTLAYNPAAPLGQTLATIAGASATITPLDGATATLTNLTIRDNGFSLGDGSLSVGSFKLGGILSATAPAVAASGVSYTAATSTTNAIATGTITATAGSVSLFAGQAGFASPGGSATTGNGLTLAGFSGTYQLGTNALTIAATGAELKLGKLIDATATNFTLGYTPASTSAADAVTLGVGSLTATSPLFNGVTGTLSGLSAGSTGVTLASGSLSDGTAANPKTISVGGIASVTDLNFGLAGGFNYDATSGKFAAGAVTIGSDSATLFSGQSAFTATMTGFGGSYTFATGALALSATEIDLGFGKALTAKATNVAINYDGTPTGLGIALGGATLSSGYFPTVKGSLSGVTANSAGLAINGATLEDTGTASLGGVVSVTDLRLGVSNFFYAAGSPTIASGTVTVASGTAAAPGTVTLFPGQAAFTDTVTGFAGSYTFATGALALSAAAVHVGLGKALTIDATNVAIGWDGTNATVALGGAAITSGYFPTVTGTLSGVTADDTGLKIDGATLEDKGTVSIGGILSATDLRLGVSNFVYDAASKAITGGSVTVASGTAAAPGIVTLFGGQSAFTAALTGFGGSYTFGTGAVALSATEIDLGFGKALTAKATNVAINYDGTPTGLGIALGGATLSSGYFPTVTGTLTGVTANSAGLKIDGATLEDTGTASLGGVVSVTDLRLGVSNFFYAAGATTIASGTVTVAAGTAAAPGTVTLFPGQAAFTDTVTGFAGSYTFATGALALSAAAVHVGLGKALTIDATNVAIGWDGTNAGVSLGGAALTSGYFPSLRGTLTGVNANNAGLSIDGATLSDSKDIMLGSFFEFKGGLTLAVHGFSYSTATHAIGAGSITIASGIVGVPGLADAPGSLVLFPGKSSITDTVTGFVGSYDFTKSLLSLTATGVALNFGSYVTATAGNLAVTWDGTNATVSLGTATFTANIGNYLSLSGSGSLNTAPAGTADIADIDSISATFMVGTYKITGTATNFAINNSGQLAAEANKSFGVALALGDSNTSEVQWPSWLPIHVTTLAASWPDFTNAPTNFSLTLSADVTASFAGGKVALSGSVTNAVINVGLLEQGAFPITSLGGASLFASGAIGGGTVKGGAFLSILNVNAENQPITPDNAATVTDRAVARRIFYGGIDAGFSIKGAAGFEIRVGLSQLGPLSGFIEASVPILLDPDTGLTLNNMYAGIQFDTALAATTDPKALLPGGAFTPQAAQTPAQWEASLQAAVIKQVASPDADPFAVLGQTMLIDVGATLYSAYATSNAFRIDGDLQISTDGKILISGKAVVGNTLSINAGAYFDLSQVALGRAVLLLYVQAPAEAPILSAFGSVIIQASGGDLTLDGASGSATIPNAALQNNSINNSSFSLEFWARPSDTGKAEVVASEGNTDFQAGYDATNHFYVSFGTSRLTTPDAVDTSWHHWAVTYDKASGVRTIYMNGVAVATDGTAAAPVAPVSTKATGLLIGQAGSAFFHGSVDDIRVWSLARTAAQIQAYYTADDTTTFAAADLAGLVGSFTFLTGSAPNGVTLSKAGTSFTVPTGQTRAPIPGVAGFTITIGGELDLTLPSLPGGLTIAGSASFSVNTTQASLDLAVNGMASIGILGAGATAGAPPTPFATLVGDAHFDVNQGTPELYGAFRATFTTIPLLANLGLSLTATAFLEFNTTAASHDVVLTNTDSSTTPPTVTSTDYKLAPRAVTLYVPSAHLGYKDIFEVDADLYASFSAVTLPSGQIDPELDMAFDGTIQVGPASNRLITLAASGVFILNSGGVAASIAVTTPSGTAGAGGASLGASPGLAAAGITVSPGSSVGFAINTFGKDVDFTTPAVSDGTTTFPAKEYKVPGIPAIVNPPAAAVPYVVLTGNIGLTLKGFSVNGGFDVLVTPSVFRIDLLADTLSVKGLANFSETVNGGLAFYNLPSTDPTKNDVGFAGLINASFGAGQGTGSSLFSITGTFNLAINTAAVANKVGTTTIPAQTGEIDVTGDLLVGPSNAQFDVRGTLRIVVNASGLSASVLGSASLGALGSLRVGGSATDATVPATLTIDSSGLKGNIGLYGSFKAIAGATLTGTAMLQIDTSAKTYVVNVTGDLTIAGGAVDLSGSFHLALTPPPSGSGPDTFTITAQATLSVFNTTLAQAEFFASIYNDGAPELALYAGLNVNVVGNSLFSFRANPDLIVNTGSQAIGTGFSDAPTIAPKMAEFDLKNASGTILGFHASGTLIASFGSGGFDFQIPQSNPLTLGFLDVGSMSVYGDINSNGSFSVTGTIHYDASKGPFELYGTIGATIASTGFSASFDGGANLNCGKLLGTHNLASVGASITVMTDHLEISAHAKVLGIGFSFDASLGSYSPPAHNAGLNSYGVPTVAVAGSTPVFTASAYNQANTGNLSGGQLDWEVRGPGYTASGSGTSYQPTLAGVGTYTVSLYDQADGHLLLKQSTLNTFALAPTIGSLNLLPSYLAGNGSTVHMAPSVTVVNPANVTVSYAITKNGAAWSGTVVINPDFSLDITPDAPNPAATGTDVYAITYTIKDQFNGSATATGSFSTIDIHNLTVNSTDDTEQTNSDGTLIDTPSVMTLRQAIDIIETNLPFGGASATIRFDPSLAGQTITLNAQDRYIGFVTPALSSIDLLIAHPVTIDATNAPGLTISTPAQSTLKAFCVNPGGSLTLDNVNIVNCSSIGEGGAIYVAKGGSLQLNRVAFVGNTVGSGTMTYQPAGAILPSQENFQGEGGAVYVASGATLTAVDSTFAGNSATTSTALPYSYGGAIYVAGTANLLDDTIAGNSASVGGSGLFAGRDDLNNEAGQLTFTIYNTIIAGNTLGDFNDYPTAKIVAGDHNIIPSMSPDIAAPAGSTSPFRLSAFSAGLGLLAQRDGSWTYSLLANSPALGQGRTSFPSPAPTSFTVPTLDARGLARTVGGLTDIGAFERQSYVVTNPISVGPNSLAEALATDDDGSTITFASNLTGINLAGQDVTVDPSGDGSYSESFYYNGPLSITRNVTIVGPSGGRLTIDAGLRSRIFAVSPGVTASISNLTLSNGEEEQGGAILNSGNLTLDNILFSNNIAQGDGSPGLAGLGAGGAIYNASGGKLTVTNSTFSNNAAIGAPGYIFTYNSPTDGRAHTWDGGDGHGGAIDNEASATLNLIDDTFSGNSAAGGAGTSGQAPDPSGKTVVNYQVSGNGGSGFGGGVVNYGTASISSTTFAYDATAGGAAGSTSSAPGRNEVADIFNIGKLNLANSIAADAQGGTNALVPGSMYPGDDVLNQGTITGSNNLIMAPVNIASGVVLTSADPQLKPLGNYGGSQLTFLPTDGSPELGKALVSALPALDERGVARSVTTAGDLGAVQVRHFVVTTTANSGPGSLRAAIIDDIDQTAITFAPSLAGQSITVSNDPLVIARDLVITGLGANSLTIQGSTTYSGLFVVNAGVNATISGLTLSGGNSNEGGAIFNSGNLNLVNDTFSKNIAQGNLQPGLGGVGAGGALFNAPGGVLTVTGSTFINNQAIGEAGNTPATAGGTVPNDDRANPQNGSEGHGGAIDNELGGRLSLVDDTFSGNSAAGGNGAGHTYSSPTYSVAGDGGSGYAGSLINRGIASVVNSTFAYGATYGGLGGTSSGGLTGHLGFARVSDILNQAGGSLTIYNTIASNYVSGSNEDILNQGTIAGSNNVSPFASLPAGLIISTADPKLGPLGYHGGTTQTFNLLPGSSAFAVGNVAVAPALDQRGFNRVVSGAVDAGAFEFVLYLPVAAAGPAQTIHAGNAITYDASATQNLAGFSLTYSWSIADATGKVVLTGPSGTASKVTGPSTGLAPGSYTITVTVSDGFSAAQNSTAQSRLMVLPAITITSITTPTTVGGAISSPFDTADITFSAPVDPNSVLRAVTLSRQGPADLSHAPGGTSYLTATLVPGSTSTYRIAGIAALVAKAGQGQFFLAVDATQVGDLYGTGSGKPSTYWTYDTAGPQSYISALPASSASTSFAVFATGLDPSPNGAVPSGLASYDLWVSANGGAWAFWTNVPAAKPTATFTGTPGATYSFESFGHDAAGNIEARPLAAEATTAILNTSPPTAAVTGVDASTSTFAVTFAGTAAAGNVLDHVDVYASVDGSSPLMIGRSTTGSGTILYIAIADGQAHHYGFFAIGVDKRGNAAAMPAGPGYDQNITAAPFAAPAVNAPIALTVNHGSADRSFVRYVDLIFSNNTNLQSLISGNKLSLVEFNLQGGGPGTVVPLAGDLKVVDHAIEIDFGALGLGGSPRSNAADGYYGLYVNGFARPFTFDRLLGDINGDRTVDATDIALATAAFGNPITNQATDVDGTGTVSATDLALVQKAKGRQLASYLRLDG